jgi:hypothetical protein
MITAPKKIDFIEPGIQHPNSENETIFDVAEKLEQRYSLLQIFIALHKKDLEQIIISEMALAIKHDKSNDEMDGSINDRITPIWRAYILNEEHGIITMASEQRGSASFVDTGSYFTGLSIGVSHE